MFIAPKNTPMEIINKLDHEINYGLNSFFALKWHCLFRHSLLSGWIIDQRNGWFSVPGWDGRDGGDAQDELWKLNHPRG